MMPNLSSKGDPSFLCPGLSVPFPHIGPSALLGTHFISCHPPSVTPTAAACLITLRLQFRFLKTTYKVHPDVASNSIYRLIPYLWLPLHLILKKTQICHVSLHMGFIYTFFSFGSVSPSWSLFSFYDSFLIFLQVSVFSLLLECHS